MRIQRSVVLAHGLRRVKERTAPSTFVKHPGMLVLGAMVGAAVGLGLVGLGTSVWDGHEGVTDKGCRHLGLCRRPCVLQWVIQPFSSKSSWTR